MRVALFAIALGLIVVVACLVRRARRRDFIDTPEMRAKARAYQWERRV